MKTDSKTQSQKCYIHNFKLNNNFVSDIRQWTFRQDGRLI